MNLADSEVLLLLYLSVLILFVALESSKLLIVDLRYDRNQLDCI